MKLVQIKETINNSELSIDDLTELSRHIENRLLQLNTDDFMQEGIDRKLCQNFSCIHCKSTKIVKNGTTSKGKQKYICPVQASIQSGIRTAANYNTSSKTASYGIYIEVSYLVRNGTPSFSIQR